MIQVCGYAAQHAKSPLMPYYFERREPRDHDVVIDIQYCGICHSDIHQVNNGWGASTYPMVPGHEIVGVVCLLVILIQLQYRLLQIVMVNAEVLALLRNMVMMIHLLALAITVLQ